MHSTVYRLSILLTVIVFASCAQPARREKPVVAGAQPVGSVFDQVGNVTLYAGQPCTSQIMFVFHGARSRADTWMAAPMRQSKILTDAVHEDRTVHVVGKWRRGRNPTCYYVEAAQVETKKKSFW